MQLICLLDVWFSFTLFFLFFYHLQLALPLVREQMQSSLFTTANNDTHMGYPWLQRQEKTKEEWDKKRQQSDAHLRPTNILLYNLAPRSHFQFQALER